MSPQDRLLLSIWRAGASSTPTRRFRGPLVDRTGAPNDVAHCPFCLQPQASARHFWADCSRFDPLRALLEAEFSIPPSWWATQPRVTAKTGWVTFDAHPQPSRRAAFQVAACRLGIEVLRSAPPSADPYAVPS